MVIRIFFLSLVSILLNINSYASTLRGSDSYWLCKSEDSDNKVWQSESSYKRKAVNDSYSMCKKNSQLASSCQTSYENCTMIIKGATLTNNWQCSALDRRGEIFKSDAFDSRNNAYAGAKSICKQLSPFPNTCYVRLFTCNNVAL